MSDTLDPVQESQTPITTYLKDYEIPAYLIDEIDLEFDLHDRETIVTSQLRVRHNRHSRSTQRSLILNGEALELVSIKLDGRQLTAQEYQLKNDLLVLTNLPDNFQLEIVTRIYPDKNTELSGLYRSGNTYCTQCEAEGFRRITYFIDRPDVLSRYTTKIIADAKRYPMLLSNGNLIASGSMENGRHFARWEDPFKKPCYLFALVAGDFDLVEDQFITQANREVALKVYVDKGFKDQTAHALYSMKQAMRWDEVAYGREYDLDTYMVVAISDFNNGAMENKGLNIFNTQYALAKPETATDDNYIHISSVIAHEYFHNWSGNRVTCRDWFQLSLKEGLTIFRDQSFSEDTISHAVMRIRDVKRLREAQFPEDAGPLAHSVRPESYMEINNFYTATIYEKGAEVLRMLQTILGKNMFRKGMDLYFSQHDGEAVTIDDFVARMEDVSGVNLQQFRLWYSQAGTPQVSVTGHYDKQKQIYTLTIEQQTPATPGQPHKQPLHIPVRVGLMDASGKAIPLTMKQDQPANELETVLHLTAAKKDFHFYNVSSQPIPSLLRNFSAPVKLFVDYTDEELIFLAKHDVDAFNRWEAGQQYALRVLLKLVNQCEQKQVLQLPEAFVKLYEYLLEEPVDDKLLKAEMLMLPSENMMGEQMSIVSVDAIHTARECVMLALAKRLMKQWLRVYQENITQPTTDFDLAMIGARKLKNTALSYLMLLPECVDLGYQQFQAAINVNMTDVLAALVGLVNTDSPLAEQALAQFYQTWRHDPLVVDKWLAIQAGSKQPGTLDNVKNLIQHEAFDLKNPNKIYALIATFGRNLVCLHAADGSGYEFLREFVQKLDKLNPQVAARMVNPLTTWKRYDKQRQQLMRKQLQSLAQAQPLSPNLFELVNKSLNDD